MARSLELQRQGKTIAVARMLERLQHKIDRGGSLWESMSGFPGYFDDFQVMFIRAAEENGTLVDSCQNLSRYYKMRRQENRRLLVGLLYPVFLIHAVILLPSIKYLILPQLGVNYWQLVLPRLLICYGAAVVPYFLWTRFCGTGRCRERADKIKLSIPGLRNLVMGLASSRIFWVLGHMLNSGTDAVTAMRGAARASGNSEVIRRMSHQLHVLEKGGSFTDYFTACRLFNMEQVSTVMVAEESGTLVESLLLGVQRLEAQNAGRFRTLIKVLIYGAYILVAVYIAYFVISFYMGHFGLIQ